VDDEFSLDSIDNEGEEEEADVSGIDMDEGDIDQSTGRQSSNMLGHLVCPLLIDTLWKLIVSNSSAIVFSSLSSNSSLLFPSSVLSVQTGFWHL